MFLKKDIRFNEFSMREFSEAWTLYKKMYVLIGTLTKELRNICMHPLMLRFLAEGFEGQKLPIDVRRIEIFDQYWTRKLEHTGKEDKATEYMFKIVRELKRKKNSELLKTEVIGLLKDTTANLETVLSKILSENLITYLNLAGERVVGFSYEAFFEYVMARWIMYGKPHLWFERSNDVIISDLINFIEESRSYRTMKGTLQYLVMMMEEKKNDIHISMLEELYNTKDPAWHSFIINVVYKLKTPIKVLDIIGKLAEEGDLRSFAIRALGDLGGDGAIKYLAKALEDDDEEVWDESVSSLSKIGSLRAMKKLAHTLMKSGNLALKHAVVKAFSKEKKPQAIPILWEILTKGDKFAKNYVIEILGEFKDNRVIRFLLDAIREGDDFSVLLATEALGKIFLDIETLGDAEKEEVTDILIKLLAHHDTTVRISAIDALGGIRSRRAIKPLLELLNEEKSLVRTNAMEAVAMIGGEDVLPIIIKALAESDTDVRKSAIISLGIIGSEKAIPTLAKALSTEYMLQNRRLIHRALMDIGINPSLRFLLDVLTKKDYLNICYVIEAIGSLQSEEAIDPLIRFLDNNPDQCKKEIVDAIGNIGGDYGSKKLVDLLQRNDKDIKLYAIEALGRTKEREATKHLIKFVEGSDDDLCVQSVIAIGSIGDPGMIDYLIAAKSRKDRVRSAVATALGLIGGERVIDPLIDALEDENINVRSSSAASLGILRTSRGITPLLKSLANEKDNNVIQSIVGALGEIGNVRAVSPLLDILKGGSSEIIRETIIALGKIGSARASESLAEIAESYSTRTDVGRWDEFKDFRFEAVEALGKIGDKIAADTLMKVLKKPLPDFRGYRAPELHRYEKKVRRAARNALMNIFGKEIKV